MFSDDVKVDNKRRVKIKSVSKVNSEWQLTPCLVH